MSAPSVGGGAEEALEAVLTLIWWSMRAKEGAGHIKCDLRGCSPFGRRFLGLASTHTEYGDLHATRGLLAGFFGDLDHSPSNEHGSAERCW